MTVAARTSPTAPRSSRRLSWDVIRVVAIVFVVLGHTTGLASRLPGIEPYPVQVAIPFGTATLLVLSGYFIGPTIRRGVRVRGSVRDWRVFSRRIWCRAAGLQRVALRRRPVQRRHPPGRRVRVVVRRADRARGSGTGCAAPLARTRSQRSAFARVPVARVESGRLAPHRRLVLDLAGAGGGVRGSCVVVAQQAPPEGACHRGAVGGDGGVGGLPVDP